MARGTQSGRIHLHQRNTDDVSQLINADMTIMAEHVAAINATTQKEMDDKTQKENRIRIRHIYRWWMEHYPNYFENGTRVLTQEEKEDQVMFHHTNDRDIIYTGLNVLSHKKNKSVRPDGTIIMSSNSDIKKYNDAIKWGAKRAGQALPSSFYAQMESFILSYKKEHQQAQKEGRTDEQEADPITSTLFRMICFWAVKEGNVFVWVFSLAMWHLMSRSISIDSLAFHNIKSGTSDSIKFKFDETKADKTGEFTQEKKCYANPLSAHLCYFLSLGCWISSNAKRLASTEKLFLSPGTKNGSASQRYCTQLSEMVMRHQDVAKNHLRLSHFNAHGLRKGSGSHASSATTLPPSFVAVAARGEWSIGKILDVYFKFALGGDQYLGRILALLDPNTESFSILPPHWTNPAHLSIFRGINICFGDVVTAHSGTSYDPSGVLSLLLASMVHHSDWLIGVCSKYPSHPFHLLPLLHDNDLLIELKSLVTLEPNSHVPMATGVPSHVSHTQAIKEVRQVVTETKNIVVTFRDDLKKAVSELTELLKKQSEELASAEFSENVARITYNGKVWYVTRRELEVARRQLEQMYSEQYPSVPEDQIAQVAKEQALTSCVQNKLFSDHLSEGCSSVMKSPQLKFEIEKYYPGQKKIRCDFYLPDYDIWIELCGMKTESYLKKMKYKNEKFGAVLLYTFDEQFDFIEKLKGKV